MRNRKKNDELYVNKISPPNHVENVSNQPVGNAGKDSFCLYDNKRHAVGSKLMHRDGSVSICTEDGTWQNS